MSINLTQTLPQINDLIDRSPLILPKQTPLLQAIQQMQQHRTSCIIVTNSPDLSDSIMGIFTERNAVLASAQGTDLNQTRLSDFMSSPLITQRIDQITDIFTILQLFKQHHIRHIPVLQADGKVLGLISQESIRHALKPSDLLRRRPISEVMTTTVIQATSIVPVSHIISLMSQYQVSCVVLTERGKPIGILTERDVVKFQAQQLDLNQTIAYEVMSHPLQPIQAQESLWNAKEKMEQLQVRRLVVIQADGTLAGIITQSSMLSILDPIEMAAILDSLQSLVDLRTKSLTQEIKQHQATTFELEKALTDLQIASQTNRTKDEFLTHLNHELRTPLTAILGFTELISTDLTLSEDNRKNLSIINRNGKHLLNLINNLLELSKIESGYLQLHSGTCDLWSLLQDMEGLFRLRSQAKEIEFSLLRSSDFPRYLITDEKKLRQILINLLSNAVRFTNVGSVKLITQCNANYLSFQIVDTGPGIPEADRSRLFTPFAIAASPQQFDSGTGIGLAISQQLTQVIGGELMLLDQNPVGNMGSTFELRIPQRMITTQPGLKRTALNKHAWLLTLKQAAMHLNSASCRQLIESPPPSLTSAFIGVLSDSLDQFDFDWMVTLIIEQLSDS